MTDSDLNANASDGNRVRHSWQPLTTAIIEPFNSNVLQLECRTWHRDSHELFDYESQHIHRGKYFLKMSARVFRNAHEITVDVDQSYVPNQGDYLLSIKAKDGKYYVFPAERNSCLAANVQPRKLWLITRFLDDSTYPLSVGDVIKLGRFKLRIKQIVPEHTRNTLVDYQLDDTDFPIADMSPEDAQTIQCRICLLEGCEQDNPLVRACQCRGSIMYVHLECLRHWVNGRLNLSEDLSRSCCFVRQIQCELCKATFPSFVTSHGERLPVVKIPQLEPPFIVLENMVGPAAKGVHLCSLANRKECKLGRGHESDVRIADVSISRWHATIKYVNGVFQLEDHNSKFGTLVALRKPVVIDNSGEHTNRLSVQVGRTVMEMCLSEDPPRDYYDEVRVVEEAPTASNMMSGGTNNPSWGA